MSAGDSSILDPFGSSRFTGTTVEPALGLHAVIPSINSRDERARRSLTIGQVSAALPQKHALSAGPILAAEARVVEPSKRAWLWRSTNLTTVAVGCGAALVLQTADSLYLSSSLPKLIAGSAPHIFPPLFALLVSAFLAVLPKRSHAVKMQQREPIAERFMLATTAFATMWTAVEWLLRTLDLSAGASSGLSLEVLFTAVVLLFYVMTNGRVAQRIGQAEYSRDVLIVGTDAAARDVRGYLASLPHAGYRFRGFISTVEHEAWSFAGVDEVAGHVDELMPAARSMFVDEVIVASQPSLRALEELCGQAREHKVTLRFVPSMSESLRRAAEVEYIGSLPTIVAYRRMHRPASALAKRVLDISLGSIALMLLSPVFLAIALAVKLSSEGPVFYASQRVGVKGKGFPCYKFRTMVRDADALRSSLAHLNERKGILFKIAKDPRVTPLGAWLRRYSLDELPQLLNVLRGEMSLVGPRPSLRAEVLQYDTPHYRRLDVIPGMTGLWQVEARCDPSFESYVALDCRYANEWSVGLDLKILLRTLRVVFLGTGV